MIKVWVGYKKLPSGKWRIRFRAKGKSEKGINLPGTLKEKTIKSKANWYEEEIKLGRYNPWENNTTNLITVSEAINKYIDANKNINWSRAQYLNIKNRLMVKMLGQISSKAKMINITDWNWYNNIEGKPSSIKAYLSSTKAFLNWCKKNDIINSFSLNLTHDVKKRINQKTIKYITYDELKEVCEVFTNNRKATEKFNHHGYNPQRHTRLWWSMFWLCLRKEEASRILHSDLMKNQIKVLGKGGSVEWIPIPPPAQKHIEWFAKNKINETLFGFKSIDNQYRQFRKAVIEALGENHHSFGFHQLRHGGAVHYLTSKVPLIFVSKLLRHKNTGITSSVYANIIKGMEGSAFDHIKDESLF